MAKFKSKAEEREEQRERVKRAKVMLFNKTSDECVHSFFQKREDGVAVRLCSINNDKPCLYKLCPKIENRNEQKR